MFVELRHQDTQANPKGAAGRLAPEIMRGGDLDAAMTRVRRALSQTSMTQNKLLSECSRLEAEALHRATARSGIEGTASWVAEQLATVLQDSHVEGHQAVRGCANGLRAWSSQQIEQTEPGVRREWLVEALATRALLVALTSASGWLENATMIENVLKNLGGAQS